MVRGLLGKLASRSLSVAGKWQQQQLRRLNIHEYQGAELMSKHGINVPKGVAVGSLDEVRKAMQEVFPSQSEVVVKSQILAGGRGLGTFKSGLQGGVHIVKTEQAEEIAGKMLGQILVTKQTGAQGRVVSKYKYDLDYKSPNKSGQNFKSGEDMIGMYKELCEAYPIVSIEDPFDKEDWEHSKYFSSLGICQVVGDDMLTSNPKRIERAVQEAACNAFLLKINQVGTVTEAIEAVKLAKDANWGMVISQRSGESEDSFLSDLAVGLSAGLIKAGAPCRYVSSAATTRPMI